jgi:hypothetical protein
LGLKEEEYMQNKLPVDPDETYEVTADNMKKILAIYMRFR